MFNTTTWYINWSSGFDWNRSWLSVSWMAFYVCSRNMSDDSGDNSICILVKITAGEAAARTVSSREGENRRRRRRRRELMKVVDLPVIRGRKVDTLPAHTVQYCKLLMFGSLSVSTCNTLWTSYYSITFFPKTEAQEQIWLFHAISMPVCCNTGWILGATDPMMLCWKRTIWTVYIVLFILFRCSLWINHLISSLWPFALWFFQPCNHNCFAW